MRKERTLNVAKALASQLHVTEEAIDTALSEAAHLIDAYVTSRRAIRMSTIVPGEIHGNTLKAMMALNTAQQYMTAAHNELSRLQDRMGLDIAAHMPVDQPTKPPETGTGTVDRNVETMLAVPAH
jgi:hypothetical protein